MYQLATTAMQFIVQLVSIYCIQTSVTVANVQFNVTAGVRSKSQAKAPVKMVKDITMMPVTLVANVPELW